MSHCPRRDQLELLLGQRLEDTELDEIEQHVQDCAACQLTLEQLTADADWCPEPRRGFLIKLNGGEPELSADPPLIAAGVSAGASERFVRGVPTVAGYDLKGELGRGGMGVVYEARHIRLNRPCALKMILAGAHAGLEDVARFVTEAEAIARLAHPNIVQIRHIGETDGLPFLELEYVAGGSLDQQLDGTPWSPARAARLAEQVALGIAEAHRQGIVHRDLKPSNVLVAADGTPKVGDFGLAKMLDNQSELTGSESVMGSPSYMAPEQAQGRAREVGPAVDVYAVGAILYELLTGRPPFRGTTALETLEQVKTTEPVPPSRLVPGVPRDVETVCLKCLQKEPGKRYENAPAIADDLRRFLDGRPILARRIGGAARAWRWCRRNPGFAAANTAAALLMIMLLMSTTLAAWTSRAQLAQIRGADRQTRENLLEALTAQARAQHLSRQVGQRFETMDALGKAAAIAHDLKLPGDRFDLLRNEAIACLALPDMKKTDHKIIHPPGVILVAVDPTMARYALRFVDGSVQVRGITDNHEIANFQARGDREIAVFAFSPNGRYLATTHYPGYALTIWDIDRRAIAVNDRGSQTGLLAKFSPDSQGIAVMRADGEFLIYSLVTGLPVQTWRGQTWPHDLAFRPDGSQIAVVYGDAGAATCNILDAASGALVRSIALRAPGSVTWSPDGTTLATSGSDHKFYLWDAASGISRSTLDGSHNGGLHATFHPTSSLLASNSWESRLRIWDVAQGRPVLSIAADDSLDLRFSQDGQMFVSRENQSNSYRVDPSPVYRSLTRVSAQRLDYRHVSIRNDNRLVASATDQGVVLWDLARGTELAFLPIGETLFAIFEESGDLLTHSRLSLGVHRWPIHLELNRREFRVGPPHRLPLPRASGIAVDKKSRILAVACTNTALFRTDERTTRVGPLVDCRYVAVSPDGRWLATGSHQRGAQVWRVRDASRAAVLPIDQGTRVVFSPDSKRLMTAHPPCQLWAVDTWREELKIAGTGLCFSQDGRTVLVQDTNKVLRLVATETGHVLARLESPDSCEVAWATFNSEGSRVVFATNDGPAVHVWDLRAIRRELAPLGLDWDAPAYTGLDPASPSSAALPPLSVDLGPLASHAQDYSEPAEVQVERHTVRLAAKPDDVDAYHHRGHAYNQLRRTDEAIDDLTQAIRLRPDDMHLRVTRAEFYERMGRNEPAIADLEVALASDPSDVDFRESLARHCHARQTYQARGPELPPDPERKLLLAHRAVELAPDFPLYLHALGIAQYRACQYAEAVATWERSLAIHAGWYDGRNFYYLAIAHHRLGNRARALECFDRGVRWEALQDSRSDPNPAPLAAFRASAAQILAGLPGELPADVFAPPR